MTEPISGKGSTLSSYARDIEICQRIGQLLHDAAPDDAHNITMRAKLFPRATSLSASLSIQTGTARRSGSRAAASSAAPYSTF
ncbi:hypothetical protein T281_06180 [Rhodomicrobium udaipurense JA643]|nr:hypothetical protein T281_06180 [Rhodomicrobium udaipurense JA643]